MSVKFYVIFLLNMLLKLKIILSYKYEQQNKIQLS